MIGYILLGFILCYINVIIGNEEVDPELIQQFGVDVDGKIENIIPEPVRAPTAIGIQMKNSRKYMLDYYWVNDNNGEHVYQGMIHPRGVTATNAYVGHTFYFTKHNKKKEIHRIYVDGSTNLFIIPPKNPNKPHKYYQKLLKELEFVTQYKERTGNIIIYYIILMCQYMSYNNILYFDNIGQPWLAHYPRDPPIHHMWDADYIGQKHIIKSDAYYWNCIPDDKKSKSECQSDKEVEITIEVVALQPRAFIIHGTLSDAECEIIKQLAIPKLKRSRAGNDGGLESDTRTSSTTWISRKEHFMIDTIYKRASHIANISDSLFHPGTKSNIVEDLQVVYYKIGQEYTRTYTNILNQKYPLPIYTYI